MSYTVVEFKAINEKLFNSSKVKPPKVVALALKGKNNKIYVWYFRGDNHSQLCKWVRLAHNIPGVLDLPHGYLLADGSFANRYQAMEAAYANNQLTVSAIDRYKVGGRSLYSYELIELGELECQLQ